jgi:hypothetical protein
VADQGSLRFSSSNKIAKVMTIESNTFFQKNMRLIYKSAVEFQPDAILTG